MRRRSRWSTPLLCGSLEAAALVASFVLFGVGWAAFQGGAGYAAPYPEAVAPQAEAPETHTPETRKPDRPRVWLVDGYNVICAGAIGVKDRQRWWCEANRSQLLELVEHFNEAGENGEEEVELWVVFDGDRSPEEPANGRTQVVFATPADDWLLAQVRARAGAAEVAVVTADRPLADRAKHRGARVVSPRDFVRRCLGPPPQDSHI